MKFFDDKTIVVPFDFSDLAGAAVDKAIEWSTPSTIVYVVYVADPIPAIISIDVPIPHVEDQQRAEQAQKQLQESFADEKYSGLKISCLMGDPGSEIVNLANEVNADLIMMPSHGYSGVKRVLLGSVAERVLRLSSCPVLIMRGLAVG